MMKERYGNDFWQVCAALDNEDRLTLLRRLMIGEPMSVVGLAHEADECVSSMSRALKLLREVGLVEAVWHERKAFYRVAPQTEGAALLLGAIKDYFRNNGVKGERLGALVAYIHALSHPRRNEVINFLTRFPGATAELISDKLDLPTTTTARILSDLDHAKIVDMNHHVFPPEAMPERLFFEFTTFVQKWE